MKPGLFAYIVETCWRLVIQLEEWDERYNGDVEEVLFMDPQKVLFYINKAMELIHTCVDMEAYKEGCELAEILSVLEVNTTGVYNDFDGSPLNMR